MTMDKCLQEEAESVVEKIRVYSRLQREYWQQIPLLALEADGRCGFSERLHKAYRRGCWPVPSLHKEDYYPLLVDLENGELLDAFAREPKPARNDLVLPLGLHLEELDAQRIVESLRHEAKAGYASYYSPEKIEQTEQRRQRLKKELGLSRQYSRTSGGGSMDHRCV